MRTKLLILAVLSALAVTALVLAPSMGIAADAPKGKGKAAAAPGGPYDPTTQQGYRAEEVKKMEAALPTEAYAKPAKPRKLLVYVESKGYYHDSIPLIAVTLKAMGDKLGTWETTWNNDPNFFTAENLAKYDGVFMDNTVTESPNTEEGRKALLDYVKSGKGFMGCHAGADCNHKWAEYADLIGGEFVGHVWGEPKASVRNEDPKSPLCAMLPAAGFTAQEEYYTFGKPTQQKPQGYSRDKVHVLLSIDCPTSKLDPNKGQQKDGDYALSWIKKYGDGRVFYTAYGHRHEHFWSAPLLKHYLAGIQYALGDLKADDTPSGKKDWKAISGPPLETPVINPMNPGK
jgi:uncharacterized protein